MPPKQHTYQKDPFNTTTGSLLSANSSFNARSGLHSFPQMKYGEIPNGSYVATSVSNTNGIQRYNLTPQQDIGCRSSLQIHQKSNNPIKNYFGFDTTGCISVDKGAMKNIKLGDSIKVENRKPSFSNSGDVARSIAMHNSIF